jgi:hypothetical protein
MIVYGKEKFMFNLMSELRISTEDTQSEVMQQPRAYGFLAMLEKKLNARAEELKLEKDRVWGQRFVHYLTSDKTKYFKKMGKYPAQDVARALADQDEEYISIHKQFIKTKEDKETIEVCVKAFDQRANMLQTLSANERTEKRINN